jgi:pimeloyl-ACP methyl ester carboxylesterase
MLKQYFSHPMLLGFISLSIVSFSSNTWSAQQYKNTRTEAQVLENYLEQERQSAGLQSKSLTLNTIKWRYSEGGDINKPSVLLLHGLAGNRDHWNLLAQFLTPYYHVVIPDLPHNGDTKVQANFDGSVPNVTAELRHLIEHLGIQDQLNVAGHSFGGSIATIYAAEYPFDTQSLFLLNSAGIYKQSRTTYTLDPNNLKKLVVNKPGDFDIVLSKIMQNPPMLPDEVKLAKEKQLIKRSDDNIRMIDQLVSLTKIYTPDSFARLTRSVEAPTLILWGKQDKIIDVKAATELQTLLKRAEKPVLLNNVGHIPMLEAEKQVAAHYLPFLAKTQQFKNPLTDKLIPLN